MYDRTVDDTKLTFQVSGLLWNRSLVMRDIETGTLWSHLLGRGMRGEHRGVQLEMLPAAMTSWADWKARHPDTSLLAMTRTSRKYLQRVWRNPRPFVFGIPLGPGEPSPAVAIEKLQSEKVFNLNVEEESLVVTYQGKGGSVQAFRSRIEDQALNFSALREGVMKDEKTGSEWDTLTGEALSGDFQGKRLTEIPGTISYRQAWKQFHPGDKIFEISTSAEDP